MDIHGEPPKSLYGIDWSLLLRELIRFDDELKKRNLTLVVLYRGKTIALLGKSRGLEE